MTGTVSVSVSVSEKIELDLLVEAIHRRYHYDFRSYSRASLARRADLLRQRLHCETLSHVQARLLREPELLPLMIDCLTVQVSEMFRDPDYFRTLREEVIPHLRTFPSLKVWVAGCSAGEELYSLAILFREEGLESRTMFYATEINPVALARAELGIYGLDRIAAVHRKSSQARAGRASLSDYYTTGYGSGRCSTGRCARGRCSPSTAWRPMRCFQRGAARLQPQRAHLFRLARCRIARCGLFGDSLVRGGFLGLGARESLRFSDHFGPPSPISIRTRSIYRRQWRRATLREARSMLSPDPVTSSWLVDDVPEENLRRAGSVAEAATGWTLLQGRHRARRRWSCCSSNDVALALLDVQMPGMDGFELAETDARHRADARACRSSS
ncbi:CheR family methyltransferase [Ancylobacter sp.]|uniref:CheR family methyltransferase n=1 Tax=Ancylobacter sp. TaxID=1872567 RepID=UPI003C7A5E87